MLPGTLDDPNGTTRDLRSIVMIDGVEREHDGWDIDRELNGDLPAQVVSSSGLMQATGTITFADETVRENARNPFNRGTGWLPRRGQEVRIYVAHKGQRFQRFQGVIDKVRGAVGGGLTATIIDGHDRFSAEVNHEPLLRTMPPLAEGNQRRRVSLSAYYYIDKAARAAGYYCTPPRERSASLVVHGQTSLWPEVGTLQTTSPVSDEIRAVNKPAGGWMALGSFDATYSAWGGHTAAEPLQVTMTVASFHGGVGYVNVPFEAGSTTVRLTVNSARTAVLSVGGSTVASLPLGQATVVTALIKGGNATLRTNTGVISTGTTSITGGPVDRIRVYANGLAAIAGVHVSHPAASSDEFASTYWQPTANLDAGGVNLMGSIEAGPRIDARRAGDLINEITDSILSAAWIDETGVLQVVPSNALRERSPVRVVTTVDDVLSLDWEDSVLQAPSRVSVTTDVPAITNSLYRNVVVWEGSQKELTAGEEQVEFVEPSGSEDWIMVQDDIVKVGAFSSASWDYVNGNRRTVGGGYYARDGELISSQPEGFTVEMEILGVTRYLIRTTVSSAPTDADLVCAAPVDHPAVWGMRERDPLPRVNAFGKVERTTERVSAVTVAGPGPELEHNTGPWVMHPDISGEIANYIAGQTASPQPVIRNLDIFPDPRLQLGDMIEIESDTLLGVSITALIVGLSEGMDRSGGMTQSLTVRIREVQTTAENYQGWEDALSSGTLTYSALNALPPVPQTYGNFNRN